MNSSIQITLRSKFSICVAMPPLQQSLLVLHNMILLVVLHGVILSLDGLAVLLLNAQNSLIKYSIQI